MPPRNLAPHREPASSLVQPFWSACGRYTSIVIVVATIAAAAQQAPAFEVASIKLNTSGATAQSSRIAKGSVVTTNVRVRGLLVSAYSIRPERIVGAPSWIDQERFDITARAPVDTPDSQLRLMLRTLLVDRFRLVARNEVRELPVYALVVDRTGGTLGPELKVSTACNAAPISNEPQRGAGVGGALPSGERSCTVFTGSNGRAAYIVGGARPIDALVQALQGLTDRPVINRTGLTGTYDFYVRFSAASASPLSVQPTDVSDVPSIFSAVQEQLGLRLEPTRGPVEVVVVESIERPTPD
ncbi:MAG: TIGR03435 family protein [Vicinamibacterales bacterium]